MYFNTFLCHRSNWRDVGKVNTCPSSSRFIVINFSHFGTIVDSSGLSLWFSVKDLQSKSLGEFSLEFHATRCRLRAVLKRESFHSWFRYNIAAIGKVKRGLTYVIGGNDTGTRLHSDLLWTIHRKKITGIRRRIRYRVFMGAGFSVYSVIESRGKPSLPVWDH